MIILSSVLAYDQLTEWEFLDCQIFKCPFPFLTAAHFLLKIEINGPMNLWEFHLLLGCSLVPTTFQGLYVYMVFSDGLAKAGAAQKSVSYSSITRNKFQFPRRNAFLLDLSLCFTPCPSVRHQDHYPVLSRRMNSSSMAPPPPNTIILCYGNTWLAYCNKIQTEQKAKDARCNSVQRRVTT